MRGRDAIGAVVGLAVAALLVLAATAGGVDLAEQPPSLEWELPVRDETDPDLFEGVPDFSDADRDTGQVSPLVQGVLDALDFLVRCAALGVLVWLGHAAWRSRPRVAWRRIQEQDFDVLDDLARSVTAEADAQHAALSTGVARNAIVACWARLEAQVAASGIALDPAETAVELTQRVLGRYAIDPVAVTTLADLYLEARFSSHDLGEAERAAAQAALVEVHAGIGRDRARAGTR